MRREDALGAARDLQLEHNRRDRPVYFHGETMLPLFREADELLIEPVSWESLRVGQIVTYRDQRRYPTRRIVRIRRDRSEVVLKGDSLPPAAEFRVARDLILGRATARRRDGTWIDESAWTWRWAAVRALARDLAFRLRRRIARMAVSPAAAPERR